MLPAFILRGDKLSVLHLPRVASSLVSYSVRSFFMAATSAPTTATWSTADSVPPCVGSCPPTLTPSHSLPLALVTSVGKPFPLNVMTQNLSRARTSNTISSTIFSLIAKRSSRPTHPESQSNSHSATSTSTLSTTPVNVPKFLKRKWSRPPRSRWSLPRSVFSQMSEGSIRRWLVRTFSFCPTGLG